MSVFVGSHVLFKQLCPWVSEQKLWFHPFDRIIFNFYCDVTQTPLIQSFLHSYLNDVLCKADPAPHANAS